MNLPYLIPRVVRHFLPTGLTRFLLLRSLIIKPGLETSDPLAAIHRYATVLRARQRGLSGKRILLFGYGGHFDIGVGLLRAGADNVVLCDRYAVPDDGHNSHLLGEYGEYIQLVKGRPVPRPSRLMLLPADVREFEPSAKFPPVDLVVSNSVLEHVEDVAGSTSALARLTRSNGLHIHFVDLRDHFFMYPFEMLCYSELTWRRWLNPTSNHNRLRLRDYRRIFEANFDRVDIEVLQRDELGYSKAKRRIRSEFSSGNLQEDSVTLIQIVASGPRK
jgi:hypothetical protein